VEVLWQVSRLVYPSFFEAKQEDNAFTAKGPRGWNRRLDVLRHEGIKMQLGKKLPKNPTKGYPKVPEKIPLTFWPRGSEKLE
jgi:hypothetical protein